MGLFCCFCLLGVVKSVSSLLSISCELDLVSLIRMFFESEVVDHVCEQCSHGQAIFSHAIKALPRVLVVHLKRFRADMETRTYEKLCFPVDINQVIDLGEFCAVDTAPPTPSPHKKKAAPTQKAPWFDNSFDHPPISNSKSLSSQRKLFDKVDVEDTTSSLVSLTNQKKKKKKSLIRFVLFSRPISVSLSS